MCVCVCRTAQLCGFFSFSRLSFSFFSLFLSRCRFCQATENVSLLMKKRREKQKEEEKRRDEEVSIKRLFLPGW